MRNVVFKLGKFSILKYWTTISWQQSSWWIHKWSRREFWLIISVQERWRKVSKGLTPLWWFASVYMGPPPQVSIHRSSRGNILWSHRNRCHGTIHFNILLQWPSTHGLQERLLLGPHSTIALWTTPCLLPTEECLSLTQYPSLHIVSMFGQLNREWL